MSLRDIDEVVVIVFETNSYAQRLPGFWQYLVNINLDLEWK